MGVEWTTCTGRQTRQRYMNNKDDNADYANCCMSLIKIVIYLRLVLSCTVFS